MEDIDEIIGELETKRTISPVITNKDIELVKFWNAPAKNGAKLLTMPNIPTPLQGPGCQPRTIFGTSTWNKIRKKCYADADYHCEACGKDCHDSTMHCLERGSQVLTIKGWKNIEDIDTKDVVAQFSPENNEITFVNPISITRHHEDKIIRIGYKKGFSVGMSDGHRVLLFNKRNNKWETVMAKDVETRWPYYIPAAGNGFGEDTLTDDERLMIALQADGSMSKRENGKFCFNIRVKKERKAKRLRELISKTSFRYTEIHDRDYTGFLVWTNVNCKKFNECFSYKMSYKKATEFLDELVKWDGWEGTRRGYQGRCYYSSDKNNIDFVQAVAAQAGIATHLTSSNRKTRDWGYLHEKQDKSTNCKMAYNLEIKKKGSYGTQTMHKSVEDYNDDVFCITVPSSYFVARTKNGDVFITGNCHEVYNINYKEHTVTFIRVVALCPLCHLGGIHTGRNLTLYKKGVSYVTKQSMLAGAENAFTIISAYNKTHKRKLKAFSTFVDYSRQPELHDDMERLIKKYDMEFYRINEKSWCGKNWSKWKLIIDGVEYPTPYETREDWEKAMEKNNANNKISTSKLSFNEEINKMFDEIENKH